MSHIRYRASASAWFAVLSSAAFLLLAGEPAEAAREPVDAVVLDEKPGLLQPRSPRTESEQDQVRAAALYTHGRLLFRRGDYEESLKRLQRAYRWDQDRVNILGEIVALSFNLGRSPMAVRYAIIGAEKDPRDAVLTAQLAKYLVEQMELERAISLYETSIRIAEDHDNNWVQWHSDVGRLAFLTKEYAKAAAAFEVVRTAIASPKQFDMSQGDVKKLLGNARVTYSLMGEVFLEAGQTEAALEMFRQANEEKPNEALLALQRARVRFKEGKVEQAASDLNTYLAAKDATAGTQPYELLEDIFQKKHGTDDAVKPLVERLKELVKDDPSNLPLTFFLVEKLIDEERHAEAIPVVENLLKLGTTLESYQAAIRVYSNTARWGELLTTLGEAVSQVGSLGPLGTPIDQLIDDPQAVDKLLELAQSRHKESVKPEQLNTSESLAAALLALKADRKEAARTFFEHADRVAGKNDRGKVLLTWGLETFMADDAEQAAEVFQRAIGEKALPDNEADLYFYLAGALAMAEKTEAALEAATKAAQVKPDSARFQSRVPWILYYAKKYEQAKEAYLEFLEDFGDQHDDSEVREQVRDARLILSNIAVEQDHLDEAVEWLQRVLDEFPEDIGAHNDLGYLWAEDGRHLQRALRMTQKAVAAEPETAAYRDSLGWALYRLGRFDEALVELKKSVELTEDPDGVILDHLGDAYAKLGQRDEAVRHWKRAAEKFQNAEKPKDAARVAAKIKRH